eukprot:1159716-Pelagomonas_calceolata.AAC.3
MNKDGMQYNGEEMRWSACMCGRNEIKGKRMELPRPYVLAQSLRASVLVSAMSVSSYALIAAESSAGMCSQHAGGTCHATNAACKTCAQHTYTCAHAYTHTQVLALDVLRAERVVSSGGDRACRVWKIPEESQLLYRCAY